MKMLQSLKKVMLFFFVGIIANSCETQTPKDIFFDTVSCLHQIDVQLLESFIDIAEHNYKTFWHDLINKNHDVASPYRIPQIIHFIWFGSSLSQIYLDNVKTWQQYHPNWTFYFWNEQSVEKEFQKKLDNQEIFDNALRSKSYAEASDIARYEILKRFGGLYVDYDTVCLRNFDILHQNFNFYAGFEHSMKFDYSLICSNAIIGATPKHSVLDSMISDIKGNYKNKTQENSKSDYLAKIKQLDWGWMINLDDQTIKKNFTIIDSTGPGCLTRSLIRHYAAAKENDLRLVFVAPATYFYYGKISLFANHQFDGAWIEKKAPDVQLKKQPQSLWKNVFSFNVNKHLPKNNFALPLINNKYPTRLKNKRT